VRILLLDLDTLRPDHLGCYGYHRNTSPNLDKIAEQGVRFEQHYCSDAPCLPSRAALMTGRFGIHTGVVGHGGTCADLRLEGAERDFSDRCRGHNLPAMLRKAGFKTVSISPFAERHSAWWFNAGFNETYNTGLGGGESAEQVTPTALDWIARHAKDDNWFLHINYWDPHTPFRAPEAFGNPFEDEPLAAWITPEVVEQHQQAVGPHCAREIGMYVDDALPEYPRHLGAVRTFEDARRHFDGYDCGIAYMDEHIGTLLAALDEQGVLDDLAIIVTSDHGENQGEFGIYAEHGTADFPTCRIPLIIKWPGGMQGCADRGFHYGLDLAPTLMALLGMEPSPTWDGKSFSETVLRGADQGRDQLVLSQCAHICQRSVRWGPWLYMRTYHDGFRLFPQEMLFDVDADPHQLSDLAPSRPDLCREGAWRLMRWHDEMMTTQLDGYDADPMWTVMREGGPYHCRGQLDRYCERLEMTDRGWAVEELRRRHPKG